MTPAEERHRSRKQKKQRQGEATAQRRRLPTGAKKALDMAEGGAVAVLRVCPRAAARHAARRHGRTRLGLFLGGISQRPRQGSRTRTSFFSTFLAAPLTAFLVLATLPPTVFLTLGLGSFLGAAFLGAPAGFFLVAPAAFLGAAEAEASTTRGLEWPVLERVWGREG
jgi:hypothetical protein